MKKLLLILLLLSLVSCGGIQTELHSLNDNLKGTKTSEGLKTKFDKVNKQVGNLTGSLNKLGTKFDKVKELQKGIDRLNKRLEQLEEMFRKLFPNLSDPGQE